MDASCTIQDNIHMFKLNIYVSRILGTHQNRFCRVTPAQFIRYLKSFYKVNLDINKPLALYVRIFSAKDTLKFLRITYARTHQEVSRKTKLIGLCLLLRLWTFIYTLFKFRTFLSAPATLSIEDQLSLWVVREQEVSM